MMMIMIINQIQNDKRLVGSAFSLVDMFKFNFNVEENNEKDNSNVKEDNVCLSNQEVGHFFIDDFKSRVLCSIKMC
jgi:hypothetical protein